MIKNPVINRDLKFTSSSDGINRTDDVYVEALVDDESGEIIRRRVRYGGKQAGLIHIGVLRELTKVLFKNVIVITSKDMITGAEEFICMSCVRGGKRCRYTKAGVHIIRKR